MKLYKGAFWVSDKQDAAIAVLLAAHGGGFAGVRGYVPTSNYVTSPVVDLTVTSRFSYRKLIERQRKVLDSIRFEDVALDGKLADLDEAAARALFATRKQMALDSIEKTTAGDRSDSHRMAHDRCYYSLDSGVVIHYVTEKVDGMTVPVLHNGYPIAASIMLNCLEVKRVVRVPGVRKSVNSGTAVLMSNAITAAAQAKGMRNMFRVSLKEDNFESVHIGGEELLPADIEGLV